MSDLPPEIDTSRPHPARVYDALIGGTSNFAVDRETVERVLQRSPNARVAPRENRAFLGRAVRFLTAEAGLRQHDRERTAAGQAVMRDAGITMQKRDFGVFAEIAFTGLELVPPGVVLVSEWRPADDSPRPSPAEVNIYGGVARKA